MCRKRNLEEENIMKHKLVEQYMHGEISAKQYNDEWQKRFNRTLLDSILESILRRK